MCVMKMKRFKPLLSDIRDSSVHWPELKEIIDTYYRERTIIDSKRRAELIKILLKERYLICA